MLNKSLCSSQFITKRSKDEVVQPLTENIEAFKSRFNQVINILSKSFTFIEQINSQQALTYLHYCITGLHHQVKLPQKPVFLQNILASKDFKSDSYPMIGDKHIRIITIYNILDDDTTPLMLNVLNGIHFEYRWTTRFIYVNYARAEAYINKAIDGWIINTKSQKDVFAEALTGSATQSMPDLYALEQQAEALDAKRQIKSNQMKFGFYTNTITVMDEDEAICETRASELSGLLSTMGFTNQIETTNAVEAIKGSWPGYVYENIVKPGLFTLNLAHLMPHTAIWSGLERNPCRYFASANNNPPLMYTKTSGSTPFRFNLHVGDNGNTMILGPVRTGKSTLLSLIIAQWFRYKGSKVFVFDKGRSTLPLCYATNGTFYDFFNEKQSEIRLQPLANIGGSEYDRAWAQSWLEDICAINGVKVDVAVSKIIHSAINKVASVDNPKRWRMDELHSACQGNEQVSEAIRKYTDAGNYSFLDGDNDPIQLSNFTVFEMEKLMGLQDDKLLIPVLSYLVYKIKQQLTGAPTLIVFDEIFLYIQHPIFADYIKEMIKTLNKLNVTIIFATQQASDLFKSSIKEVLIENCATMVLLPNTKANSDSFIQYYIDLGLNRKQIEMIANGIPQRDYLTISSNGVREFELGLDETPATLATIGRTSKEDLDAAIRIKAEYGDEFAMHWLNYCELEDYAKVLKDVYFNK